MPRCGWSSPGASASQGGLDGLGGGGEGCREGGEGFGAWGCVAVCFPAFDCRDAAVGGCGEFVDGEASGESEPAKIRSTLWGQEELASVNPQGSRDVVKGPRTAGPGLPSFPAGDAIAGSEADSSG